MTSPTYPHFLRSFADLQNHFAEHFEGLDSVTRGQKFADFVEKLILKTNVGKGYSTVSSQKISHDGGVDFEAKDSEGNELWVQSKYRIKGKEEFDSIISKFKNRLDANKPFQTSLFPEENLETKQINFQVITLHNLDHILQIYEKSSLASVEFYKRLKSEKRIDIFDGPCILTFLQEAYLKSFVLPSEIELNLVTEYINWQDVYIGVLAGTQLRSLYEIYGDALFFENIRDYLYFTKDNGVNKEIQQTVSEEPEKMLSRNNGIVFKASSVKQQGATSLKLHEASIVNGCQTTMSVVKGLNTSENNECFVAVKIVEIAKGWDVTKTANRQNEIGKLELQIAEFLRPQRIKKVAVNKGIAIENVDSAFNVLNSIHRRSIIYDDMRALFIGLFSRSPSNLFESGEEAVLNEVLERFYREDPEGEQLFENLFTIQIAANEAINKLEEIANQSPSAGEIYQRFFKENTFSYRAFLTLLSACAATAVDISEGSRSEERYRIRKEFLRKAISLIEEKPKTFLIFYREAFRTIVMIAPKDMEVSEVKQRLWSHMKKQKFNRLLQDVLVSANITLNTEQGL